MADINTLLGRLAALPPADFSEFGEVEVKPISRIQKLTGSFLGRNWVTIPHVTHHDEVDVTQVEAARRAWNAAHPGDKITMVIVLIKVLAEALKTFPQFNTSLTEDGNSVVYKKYFNIGVAVDTPNGLLVPVIAGCDGKSLTELAREVAAIAEKARGKGLSMKEMSGSSMCISSLGHIGGTAFTPIINAPDVAILGVTRTVERAVRRENDAVAWRQMLPLSLSYDHRLINGADAARFVAFVGTQLQSIDIFEG